MFTGLNENGRYRSSIAENSPVGTSVIRVSASDRDKNPQFSKVPPRTPVIHDVVMCDSCFCRQVSYHLKPTYDWEFFTIHHESGLISSAHVFDREVKSEYYVIVVAEDGAPSDRPNHFPRETPNRGQHAHHVTLIQTSRLPVAGEAEVQIQIIDKNDERPYFRDALYVATIPENTRPGSVVMTVTAEDNDEGYCSKRTYRLPLLLFNS